MARLFDDAAYENLRTTSTPVTAVPLTLACWANTDDVTRFQVAFSISDYDAALNGFFLAIAGNAAGDLLHARTTANDSNAQAISASGVTANVWYHLGGVFTSATSRLAYLNGVAGSADTASRTPSGLSTIGVGDGFTWDGSMDAPFSGGVAECAIWNVALTAAEMAALATGLSPLAVRPTSLQFYAPLWIDEDEDFVGHLSLTAYNTPSTMAHPRVRYLRMPSLGKGRATVAAVYQPRPSAAIDSMFVY